MTVMKQLLRLWILTVVLSVCNANVCAQLPASLKAGPQYMPAEISPIVAPFDVSGINRPAFAQRMATVKMNREGLSTKAIQTAIDKMSRRGGGTVVIPDGQWQSGRIELKSGVCLHLSDGAVLTFSGEIRDYLPAVQTRNEGYDVLSLGAMIYANGAENIGLTGRGHIVGPTTDCEIYVENQKYLIIEECVDITKPVSERLCDGQEGRPVLLPMTVAPVNCKNILIEGITIDQGLFWNIVPQYCDNVIIRGVTINSAGHGRTDGIDIESTTNSLIEYCELDCGDDCYTIKSGRGEDGVKTARPSVGCVIRNSVALRGGGGLVLGSETAASMWNIYMHDCRFEGTEQGIRIKTRRPRGGGAHDIWVERVVAKDIKWNGFTVDMLGSRKWVGNLADRFPARAVNDLTPEFRNIYIKDFTVDGCQRLIDVKALPERPLSNVQIENFEGRGKDFMRLQDVSGFAIKGGTIHTSSPSLVLDGCQDVRLLDMDFEGKQLKTTKKNATLYVTRTDTHTTNNVSDGQ
jgi:polygalacturonase